MTITRQEAGEALDAISAAGQKVDQYRGYQEASPFLILWGLLWFIGNGVLALAPSWATPTWLSIIAVGTAATIALTVSQSRRAQRQRHYTRAERATIARRAIMLWAAIVTFYPAMYIVIGDLSRLQSNAFVSLFWALVYMAAGGWLGWRMFLTGLATVAAVLLGVTVLREHYFLWMAFAGGGSLLLGGLWLRKP